MTDIVDRLSKFPIAEWDDARQEILRLRDLLAEGLPEGGITYVPPKAVESSSDVSERIANLEYSLQEKESLLASLATELEIKKSELYGLQLRKAQPSVELVTANAKIEALEHKLQIVLETSSITDSKRNVAEKELAELRELLRATNTENITLRKENTELLEKLRTSNSDLERAVASLHENLDNMKNMEIATTKVETKPSKWLGIFNKLGI